MSHSISASTPPLPAENNPGAKNVMRLAWVSFLNDVGSEVLLRMIPLYVTGVLGAPMSAVGTIEGLAESTATLLKPVFGKLSDRLGKRKPFVILGYALSALSRPFLIWTGLWQQVAFLRVTDRIGKGIRTAPRDALIADSGNRKSHGKNFGLNRALDTAGALLGVAAFGAWVWHRGEVELTAPTWAWLVIGSSIPGIFVLALLFWGIREKPSGHSASHSTIQSAGRTKTAEGQRVHPLVQRYLLVVGIFGLANSSDAFIILRARELEFSLPQTLGVVALLNLVSMLTAIPAAALSDRVGRRALIASGWSIYALAYFVMGSEISLALPWVFVLTVAFYGLFFGFTESVERAWIADLTTSEDRGKVYGLFGLVVGISALPASILFGWIWDHWGSRAAFLTDAAIALVSTSLLFLLLPKTRSSTSV